MPHSPRKILKKRLRSAVIYCVALFLMIYVLADVSVLETIHGSEIVGIPALHHSVDEHGCVLSQSESSQSEQASFSETDEHNSNEDCSGEGECLVCSHIVVSYVDFNLSQLGELKAPQPIIYYECDKPKSASFDIFHPPKSA